MQILATTGMAIIIFYDTGNTVRAELVEALRLIPPFDRLRANGNDLSVDKNPMATYLYSGR